MIQGPENTIRRFTKDGVIKTVIPNNSAVNSWSSSHTCELRADLGIYACVSWLCWQVRRDQCGGGGCLRKQEEVMHGIDANMQAFRDILQQNASSQKVTQLTLNTYCTMPAVDDKSDSITIAVVATMTCCCCWHFCDEPWNLLCA